ncbi:MAG: hypothetical protein HYW37_02545 [Candidatus Colwellbacteria bacterium]|nr:hypothetical protein [Candidatus Colwellbacteria bacterium]
MNREKFKQIERILLATSLLLIVLTVALVIYSLGFLSTNLLRALAPGQERGETANFDLQGFENLDIQFPK